MYVEKEVDNAIAILYNMMAWSLPLQCQVVDGLNAR